MKIREARDEDFERIWPFFREVIAAGDTYAFARDMGRDDARQAWMGVPEKTFVAEDGDKVLGTYYIKPNHGGPGDHVCNCGYIVAADARGKGLATAMCEHSQQTAVALGYKAMQFNFVAVTNDGAVRLWNRLGFDTVGRLPGAFRHPRDGFVDALVMFKWLA
jgi:ribosomal protein S18 acetylase RimI-like enzyme